MNRNRAGRKAKLTAERQARICELIRAGHYKRVAAAQAGISEKTFYEWLQRGEPGAANYQRRFAQFREAVLQAEAESEEILLRKVLEGGPKLALEILARRFPERWRRRVAVDHKGEQGHLHYHTGPGIEGGANGGGRSAAVQIVIQESGDAWQPSDDPSYLIAETTEIETIRNEADQETENENEEQ